MTGGTASGGLNQLVSLSSCAAVHRPGEPPRHGFLLLWSPSGGGLPAATGEAVEVAVAVPADGGAHVTTVPARQLTMAEAVPALLAAEGPGTPDPAWHFWATATRFALGLIAQGRLLPGVSPGGHDAWRVGPLDEPEFARLRVLAAAMPAQARALPCGGDERNPVLPDALSAVRAFLDAVADVLPRTPAAELVLASPAFGATEPVQVPQLRPWAAQVADGVDAGVRLALDLHLVEPVDVHDGAGAGLEAVVRVQDLADPTISATVVHIWDGRIDGFDDDVKVRTVLALRRAAEAWPALEQLLHQAVPASMQVTSEDVDDLLSGPGQRLRLNGTLLRWPQEVARALDARVVVGPTGPPPSPGLTDWRATTFERAWQLAVRERPLSVADSAQVVSTGSPVLRVDGEWVLLEPHVRRRVQQRLAPVDGLAALTQVLTGSAVVGDERVPVVARGWLDEICARLSDPEGGDEPLKPPSGLDADLRTYQLRGLRWLRRTTSLGLGACLADEMGLGKTVTAIALHLARQESPETPGPTLVVCPASLLANWQREITRFAPQTAIYRYHGPGRALPPATGGIVVTSYSTMLSDVEALRGRPWGLVVADEAQHVKNPQTRTAKALRQIPAAARVAMSGTPVENRLAELWAVLDWTNPALLGTAGAFRRDWLPAVEGDRAAFERLTRLVRPFLMRRRKADPGIAPELPAKIEIDHRATLTDEQRALYEAVTRDMLRELRESRSQIARRGLVLKLLTSLKQICNHPAHYLKETQPKLDGRSGKLELFDELLLAALDEGGGVIIFTQYVQMGRLLTRHLAQRGVPAPLVHGGSSLPAREGLVRAFQAGEVPALVLSVKAAGTGLNLTRAEHVVHYDRWWNPATEDQATDRAHRIGQSRSVQVHRLITEGTLEERIATMLNAKRELTAALLGGRADALTELSDAEVVSLVTLRGE